jgi:hypothetical protein
MKRFALLVGIIWLCFTGSAWADHINGTGSVTDDWGDNHTISNTGTINTGNVVGIWQSVLWADGDLASSSCSYVDGLFGGITENATISWQQEAFPNQPSQWDGIVGTNTWGKADNQLVQLSGAGVRYTGDIHNLSLTRSLSTFLYSWTWNGGNRGTGHPTPALGC